YALIINRLSRLINSRGNKPCALVIDELPTLFIHRIENLIATARSNQVAVLMGLQELPQFQQQYGKETATTIASVVGNILSGSVRNKETLEWLERLFGKVKQAGESLSIDRTKTSLSISEKLEPLIPAGKIASLKAGELVGIIAGGSAGTYDGQFETSALHCKINLDLKVITREEQQYPEMPVYYDFKGQREEILQENFRRINQEVKSIVIHFTPDKASMY
ncbi:MAG TPA: TraM recognition domain-containing protein, partial [Puia sp.]|nr:TraM recognition domain-containing protein [Puia sp.]